MFVTVLVLAMWGLWVGNVCQSTSVIYVGLGVGNVCDNTSASYVGVRGR